MLNQVRGTPYYRGRAPRKSQPQVFVNRFRADVGRFASLSWGGCAGAWGVACAGGGEDGAACPRGRPEASRAPPDQPKPRQPSHDADASRAAATSACATGNGGGALRARRAALVPPGACSRPPLLRSRVRPRPEACGRTVQPRADAQPPRPLLPSGVSIPKGDRGGPKPRGGSAQPLARASQRGRARGGG